jgi:hypothetical protein
VVLSVGDSASQPGLTVAVGASPPADLTRKRDGLRR